MDVLADHWGQILRGFVTTLELAALSAVGSLLLGTASAIMRISPYAALRGFAAGYVTCVRNTPLVAVFFLVVFGLPELGVKAGFFTLAVTSLCLYTASYVAEAVRSGINAIPVGQFEAARALGMSFTQTIRTIVLPQSLRTVIPPLTNTMIIMLKNTAIAGGFGVVESVGTLGDLQNNYPAATLVLFTATAAMYLAMIIPLSRLLNTLERRMAVHR